MYGSQLNRNSTRSLKGKNFFGSLFTQLGYKCMDDRYNISVEAIHNNGGRTILNRYKDSPVVAFRNVYPEHEWEVERFKNKPEILGNISGNQRKLFLLEHSVNKVFRYWKIKENQKKFLD